MFRKVLAGLSLVLVLGTDLAAQELEFKVGDIEIHHPWARASKARATGGGVFMEVHNHGASMERLIGGSTPVAETVEVHALWMTPGGQMASQNIGAMDIGPGSSFPFEPDGVFLSLGGLKKPLIEGEKFPLTLNFEQAGQITVQVLIEGAKAKKGHKH
jgi:copper(I)-binding protein